MTKKMSDKLGEATSQEDPVPCKYTDRIAYQELCRDIAYAIAQADGSENPGQYAEAVLEKFMEIK